MTSNNHQEESLKAAKRAEIERLWFNQEATNEELLQAYKSLDVKNNEILENLYEEALEYVTKKNKYQFDFNQKELEDATALLAKQWFEEEDL